ncbi:MAG: F0F1 ATP synthase subunit B [Candidatus Cryptobacteroides sp.]
MNLLLPDTGLLFWMTVIFAIVFFILAKFGFPVITGMVDKRTKKIDDALEAARQADEKLASLTREHEEMITRTNAECARLLQDAAQERDRMVEQARQQAKEEADRIVAEARVRIESEKEAAMKEIRKEVASVSLTIAESIVRKELSSDAAQRRLADELFDQARNQSVKS